MYIFQNKLSVIFQSKAPIILMQHCHSDSGWLKQLTVIINSRQAWPDYTNKMTKLTELPKKPTILHREPQMTEQY